MIKDLLMCIKDFKVLCGFRKKGILIDYGWWNSYKLKQPVDKNGEPIPWVTYSFLYFIKERLKKDFIIFEYGSGNSTLWYSKYVKFVYSIEHDQNWYNNIAPKLPKNTKLFLVELDKGYETFLRELEKKFHLIIVDGRKRVECIKNSIDYLEEDGVLILDDSERDEYKEGIDFLLNKGFKKIDFWGFSPGLFYNKCTTIFYRENNCLGI